jgi:DNA-binding MarR family transcriptional regulator
MKKQTDWTQEERKALTRLVHALDEFEKLSDQFPVSFMKMFLEIALKEGLGPTEYAQRLGKIKGPASRIINTLANSPRHKEKTYDLIKKFDDPQDQRKSPIFLTAKGEALAKRLLRATSKD